MEKARSGLLLLADHQNRVVLRDLENLTPLVRGYLSCLYSLVLRRQRSFPRLLFCLDRGLGMQAKRKLSMRVKTSALLRR